MNWRSEAIPKAQLRLHRSTLREVLECGSRASALTDNVVPFKCEILYLLNDVGGGHLPVLYQANDSILKVHIRRDNRDIRSDYHWDSARLVQPVTLHP
jgi:hypothetical protein